MGALGKMQGFFRRLGVLHLVLAASFLAGLAQLAFLPVWEGFDEFAHYSSVQQIADTGTLPAYGEAHISGDVDGYAGPWPYGAGAGPDFQQPGHPSYRTFARDGGALASRAQREFQPTGGLNWQAQHPPLFYILEAPVYLATKTWGWVDHLLALRIAAWSLAFAGIAIGAVATARLTGDKRAGLVIAAYPLLSAQFVPEMARLGNDSLCLLLLSIAWAATLRMLKGEGGVRSAAILAGALGLGLLTKAFFVPLLAGVVALLALDWLLKRRPGALRDAAIVAFGAAAIGLWYYVRNYLTLGSFSGANDFLRTAEGFDLVRGLRENFAFSRLMHGFAEIGITFLAIGSWSLIIPPIWILLLAAPLPGVTAVRWALAVVKRVDLIAWAPAFFVLPLLAGLLWHMLHNLALPVRFAGTPGWYLHIAAVPIAFVMARGWPDGRFGAVLAALAVAAGIALEGLQLSLFSGCSTKAATGKGYDFAGSSCFVDWRALDAIGTPWLGVSAWVLALGLLAAAAWKARLFTPRRAPSASPSGELRSGS